MSSSCTVASPPPSAPKRSDALHKVRHACFWLRMPEARVSTLRRHVRVGQRRLEETRRQIEAETQRALSEIRREVADLALIASETVTSRALTTADHRRLIDEAIGELDFSVLEREPAR